MRLARISGYPRAARWAVLPILAAVLVYIGGSSVAAAATATAVSSEARISAGSGSVFPARSLILSVPGRSSISASEVHLNENGKAVSGAIVTPIAKASAGDFGIVIAIDVSPSMQGRSLENAMRAARALADRRAGQQELGIVEFDQTPKVVLPLTADGAAISRALRGTPAVGGGTRIFDALALSLAQLKSAHVAAGAVILVSDGADRGSTSSEPAVAAAATAAHVALYTVGVRDGAFDPQSLAALARDGGGQFLITDSSRLSQLLTQLEAGLVGRYVVHYRSEQGPGRRVHVRVTVDGSQGASVLAYMSPLPPSALNIGRSAQKSFWTSSLALLAFSIAAALLLGLGMVVFLAPRVRRDALRTRVGRFTGSVPIKDGERDGARGVTRVTLFERLLARMSWWEPFKSDVAIARFDASPVKLVAICVLASLALALLFGVGLGVAVLGLAALPLGPAALHALVRRRLHKQREEFAAQLPSHLQELASTMRAGHSLVSGIATMARAASEPSRSEWARVVADEQLGMPLEAAMRPLVRRMDCSDIEQVALVAGLQQRSGGNLAEVLERLADGVRERADLRRELDALTAQARLSRWIVTALPPILLLALAVLDAHYVSPLFHTGGGQFMLGLAIVLIAAGSLAIRRLTEIKV